MSTGSSASSVDPSPTRTRYCTTKGCKSRLARASVDPHVLCVVCRGSECDLATRCKVCESWSEQTMMDYLAHYAKLEVKRGKKPPASQGAAAKVSDPTAPDREPPLDREALKEDIRNDLKSYFDRRMDENSAYLVKEIKSLMKASKGRFSGLEDEEEDNEEPPP